MKQYDLKITTGTAKVDVIAESKHYIIHRPASMSGTMSRQYVLTKKDVNVSYTKIDLKDLRVCSFSVAKKHMGYILDVFESLTPPDGGSSQDRDFIAAITPPARDLECVTDSESFRLMFFEANGEPRHKRRKAV